MRSYTFDIKQKEFIMNKKIILSLTATALLASSLLAYNGQSQMQQGNNPGCKQGKMMKGHKGKSGPMLTKMVMRLDLSDAQRTQVRAVIKKNMANKPNPHDAFTDTSFDKKAFIALANARRDGRVEARADMIEEIYTLLEPSQKKDLKTMLDMKDIMKKNKSMQGNMKKCAAKR